MSTTGDEDRAEEYEGLFCTLAMNRIPLLSGLRGHHIYAKEEKNIRFSKPFRSYSYPQLQDL